MERPDCATFSQALGWKGNRVASCYAACASGAQAIAIARAQILAGLSEVALATRLSRLFDREMVTRQAVGPELAPGVALTERGVRIRNGLADHWTQLEEALMGELKPKQRKKLADRLRRFVDLLRL